MKPLLALIRPHQWIKNLFVFAPFFFVFDFSGEKFVSTALGFFLFCLAASAMYILNDYHDIEEDRLHPIKKNRPLANGLVSQKSAVVWMGILLGVCVAGSLMLSPSFALILGLYILLTIAYTFGLKHISILDISIIAVGFVLRVYGGAVLIHNVPSMWIILVTFLLALFLALAKRRDDCLLAQEGKKTRKNIDGYNLEMVNAAMTLMAGVTVMSYIMYTVSPDVITRLGTHHLYFTCAFVILGILRYMQLTFVEENSGSPTKLILKDTFLQIVLLGWIGSFYLIVKVF